MNASRPSSDATPRFLPLTLLLTVLLWFYTTTGGRQIFVKEILGSAYDSQAEHFLRGNVDVDAEAISHEAMIVDGKVRMYFGPFPALLRIPLNFIYPAGYGKWSRVSGFCAAVIALFSFGGLLGIALRARPRSARARNSLENTPQKKTAAFPERTSLGESAYPLKELSKHARSWLGNACLLGFALGSPLLLLLGNLSIYDEAIIWGLAWSLAALYFAFRSLQTDGAALTRSLLGFSLCAGGALLSRVTFGIPFILIAPLLAFRVGRENRLVNLLALVLPLGAALAFYVWLSYARFGNITGEYYDYYINPIHRDFAHTYGVFSPCRIPYSFADYFSLRFPALESQPPFLYADRHFYIYPALFSNADSEVYVSLLWSSGWLIFGALMGLVCLVRRKRAGLFDWGTAIALFLQFLCILSYFLLAQRYSTDLYPFLIFCLVIFLGSDIATLRWPGQMIVGLVVLSVAINALATISWLINADVNVPAQTRTAWQELLGLPPSETPK
jgi:hypothetical protein